MKRCQPNNPAFKQHYRILVVACLVFVLMSAVRFISSGQTLAAGAAGPPAPAELSDQQFWNLSKESSEDDGYFRSDNLLSNETTFQYVIPEVLRTAKQGRVYLGVG